MFPSLFRSRWWSLKQFTLSPWLPPNSTSWLRDRVVSSLSGICWCTWVMSLLWRIIDWWAADRAPSPPPPTRPTPPSRSLIRIRFYLWSCLWQLVVTIESPCSSYSFNLSSLVHLIGLLLNFREFLVVVHLNFDQHCLSPHQRTHRFFLRPDL